MNVAHSVADRDALVAGAGSRCDGRAGPPLRPDEARAARGREAPRAEPTEEPRLVDDPRAIVGPVETRRVYQISLGPWSRRFSVPESLDLLDIADRVRGLSRDARDPGRRGLPLGQRRAISRRVVFWGLALQWGFALLVLRVPAGSTSEQAGKASRVDPGLCAIAGSRFVFGKALVDPKGPAGSSSPSACCRR